MSRGNLFLGQARGKVGSVVFSRVDGKQITRTHAEKVSNPKTTAQAIQRAVFATVTKCAAGLSDVIDNTFDGFKNGAKSRQEFVRVNAERLREAYLNGDTAYLTPKGSSLAMPNNLQMSAGKLGIVKPFYREVVGLKLLLFYPGTSTRSDDHVGYSLKDLKALGWGIRAGSQITIAGIFGELDDPESWNYRKARFVIGNWVNDDDFVFDITDLCILNTAIEVDKTDGFTSISNLGIDLDTDTGNLLSVPTNNYLCLGDAASSSALAATIIVSNYDSDKDEWVHTESYMTAISGLDTGADNNTVAIPSYQAAGSVVIESDWYSEQPNNPTTSTPSYTTANSALQGIISVAGYASKGLDFEGANSYGPIPEGGVVTMTIVPNSGVQIEAGSIRVLLGEAVPSDLAIQRNAAGQVRITFSVPFGTAQSVVANVTFNAMWGGVSYSLGFRDTISKVQG